jgi:hypothetical protein
MNKWQCSGLMLSLAGFVGCFTFEEDPGNAFQRLVDEGPTTTWHGSALTVTTTRWAESLCVGSCINRVRSRKRVLTVISLSPGRRGSKYHDSKNSSYFEHPVVQVLHNVY